jgi:hypothetical protein
MAMTEKTAQIVEPGLKVTVIGKRTQTTGIFGGVGITEEGKARVIVRVPNAALPFAYDFDEVERIEVVG